MAASVKAMAASVKAMSQGADAQTIVIATQFLHYVCAALRYLEAQWVMKGYQQHFIKTLASYDASFLIRSFPDAIKPSV
jgi:hypothetical protein